MTPHAIRLLGMPGCASSEPRAPACTMTARPITPSGPSMRIRGRRTMNASRVVVLADRSPRRAERPAAPTADRREKPLRRRAVAGLVDHDAIFARTHAAEPHRDVDAAARIAQPAEPLATDRARADELASTLPTRPERAPPAVGRALARRLAPAECDPQPRAAAAAASEPAACAVAVPTRRAHDLRMTPQATRAPELPVGWVL